jgi:hypothetical protein
MIDMGASIYEGREKNHGEGESQRRGRIGEGQGGQGGEGGHRFRKAIEEEALDGSRNEGQGRDEGAEEGGDETEDEGRFDQWRGEYRREDAYGLEESKNDGDPGRCRTLGGE